MRSLTSKTVWVRAFASTTTTSPAFGTSLRDAVTPGIPPEWPTMRVPPRPVRRVQPMP